MTDPEEKTKLSRRLTGALHLALDHPEQFITVLGQVLRSKKLPITDLSIVVGTNLTADLSRMLQEARRNAPPSFENLMDMASTKLGLARNPERALATALGVPMASVAQCKESGRVPRAWFEKLHAMPECSEIQTRLGDEVKRAIRLLADQGYSPEDLHKLFQEIRTTRIGMRALKHAANGEQGALNIEEFNRMKIELFGDQVAADRCFKVWLATQLRSEFRKLTDLSPRNVERIRTRFRREIEFRRTDPVYCRAAISAELVERPRSGNSRANSDQRGQSGFQTLLRRVFADGCDARLIQRLAQLTGLDDDHVRDLLKGRRSVTIVWWEFLETVESRLNQPPFPKSGDQFTLIASLGEEPGRELTTGTRSGRRNASI